MGKHFYQRHIMLSLLNFSNNVPRSNFGAALVVLCAARSFLADDINSAFGSCYIFKCDGSKLMVLSAIVIMAG